VEGIKYMKWFFFHSDAVGNRVRYQSLGPRYYTLVSFEHINVLKWKP